MKEPFGRKARKVNCLDVETEAVIATYDSITKAAKAIGKMSARPAIINVCNGLQTTAYGYKWEYAD